MYEARQNKEKVSRRIDRGGMAVQKVKVEDGRNNLFHSSQIVQKMFHMKTRSQDSSYRPVSIPSGYRKYSNFHHVWIKSTSLGPVLMWDNPLQSTSIITSGDREEDKQGLTKKNGYEWHHCELDFNSWRCLMQLVPAYEHKSIQHIGAIHQYAVWPNL